MSDDFRLVMWNTVLLISCMIVIPSIAWCDTFTIREDTGNLATIDARLAGEGQGAVALERRDGRIEIVPSGRIVKRISGPDPEPLSCPEMIERLTERFGTEKFRALADPPYVIGLVLADPLPKNYEPRATACLKKAAGFMKTVERVFLDFVNVLKIETEKARYPLVLLIFETDDDFIQFATEDTGGGGLSASSMLGYYNGRSNRLTIRMSECFTFETPLHEAIHQQTFNRGIIARLSPVPAWFSEGIATGFQGNGEKINVGPLRVNSKYVRAAMNAKTVDWDDVVADDKAFRGDVLATEAYAHAWSIHWFLITKYRKQYIEYLHLLGEKKTLAVDDAATRLSDFERIFGKKVGSLQSEFPQWLEQAIKKQNISIQDKSRDGMLVVQANLAEVEMTAMTKGGKSDLTVEGRMRNMSHLRPMSFFITAETNSGVYADWYLPNVAPSKELPLPKQIAAKRMTGSRGGESVTFRVKVKVAVPDSENGRAWQQGQLPVPVWSGN